MRRVALLITAAAFVACARPAEEPAEEAAAPAGLTLADLAGTWNLTTIVGTDTVYTTMSGTADPASWVMNLENRDPVPLTVMVDADSVVMTGGPFESVIRAGVMVSVRTVSHLMNGQMMGTLYATYADQPDSVRSGPITGTRGM